MTVVETDWVYLTRGIDFVAAMPGGDVSKGPVETLSSWQASVRLWVTLAGRPASSTGFVVNVAEVDAAFREALSAEPVRAEGPLELMAWVAEVARVRLAPARLVQVRLMCGDRREVTLLMEQETMVQLTSKYELAASHKLWNPAWDEQQNAAAFGKCSNPRGHGHNYTVEVTVRGKMGSVTGLSIQPGQIDCVVEALIGERFDHKNLNEDTREFAELLPTVENMARVFFDLLDGRFEGVDLASVRVWETDKTCAEYFGEQGQPLRYGGTV